MYMYEKLPYIQQEFLGIHFSRTSDLYFTDTYSHAHYPLIDHTNFKFFAISRVSMKIVKLGPSRIFHSIQYIYLDFVAAVVEAE